MASLVVSGDSNVDVLCGGVCVTEGNDRDVDVRSFLDSLSVGARVRYNNETGLFERAGDIVGERTRGETASNSSSTGMSSELKNSTLAIRTSRDNTHIGWVVNRANDTSSENNLLPTW